MRSAYAPVLTSFGKDVQLKRAGHGQIIQGKDGNWYMAHLCSRSLDDCSIVGRETAIQNMTLTEDGWFKLSANDTASPEDFFEVPEEVEVKSAKSGFTDFGKVTEIPLEYMTLRQSAKTCGITISDGKLHIQGGNSLASKYNQGLLVRRHQHHSYDFTAKMEFAPRDYCHMAGLVCYYNYDNNYYLNMSVDDEGKPYVMVNVSVNKEISQSEKSISGRK